MPEPHVFGAWSASIVKKAHATLNETEERQGQIVAVLGAHGELEVQARCKPDGVVSLNGVTISGFRIVRVPRVWDDPERREAERGAHVEIGRLTRTCKITPDGWTQSVSELAPGSGTRRHHLKRSQFEPWFEDQSEDDDEGGTKMIQVAVVTAPSIMRDCGQMFARPRTGPWLRERQVRQRALPVRR
jgi:hypothetical protein